MQDKQCKKCKNKLDLSAFNDSDICMGCEAFMQDKINKCCEKCKLVHEDYDELEWKCRCRCHSPHKECEHELVKVEDEIIDTFRCVKCKKVVQKPGNLSSPQVPGWEIRFREKFVFNKGKEDCFLGNSYDDTVRPSEMEQFISEELSKAEKQWCLKKPNISVAAVAGYEAGVETAKLELKAKVMTLINREIAIAHTKDKGGKTSRLTSLAMKVSEL